EYSWLEEGSIQDQLPPALEQVQQAHLTLGPLELVLLLHRRPWHPSTLGGQRVTRARQRLLFYQELLPRRLPFLLRHDCGRLHGDMLCLVSFFAHCHHLLTFLKDDFLRPLAPKNFLKFADVRHQSSPDPVHTTITNLLAGWKMRTSWRVLPFKVSIFGTFGDSGNSRLIIFSRQISKRDLTFPVL